MPNDSPTTDDTLARRMRWPLIVVALLAGHAVLMVAAMVYAMTIPGAYVAPRGYEQALKWDDFRAEQLTAEKLGATINFQASRGAGTRASGSAPGAQGKTFDLQINDPAGASLPVTIVDVQMFHYARPAEIIEQHLTTTTPGRFTATVPIEREGMWKLKLRATTTDNQIFRTEANVWIEAPEATTPSQRLLPR